MFIPVVPLCFLLKDPFPLVIPVLLLTLVDPGADKPQSWLHRPLLGSCQFSCNVRPMSTATWSHPRIATRCAVKVNTIYSWHLGTQKREHIADGGERFDTINPVPPSCLSHPVHCTSRSSQWRDACNHSSGHSAVDIEIAFAAFSKNWFFSSITDIKKGFF